MTLIPEWMSNVHPLIVHFPIALLVFAVAADLAGLILKRYQWIKPAALWLYVFGALGTIGAYISGKQAADIVTFPPPSYSVIGTHADLALYTMLFFGIYALLRLFVAWKKWDQRTVVAVVLFIVAAGGLGLVQQTAERGGELVFRYGVGTLAQTVVKETPAAVQTSGRAIIVGQNGSWNWQAGKDAALTLRQNFKLIQGDWENLLLQTGKAENGAAVLTISPQNKTPFLLGFGPDLGNLQITARVNLSGFAGRFLLAHHITAAARYDFLAIEKNQARLGRIQDGDITIFNRGDIPASNFLTLKVVSSNGHYRGYVNDQLIVHGHGPDLPPGPAGFALSGTGSIQITGIDVLALDEKAPMMNMEQHNMSPEDTNSSSNH